LGSYLQEAARQSDYRAIAWGVGILILVVVLLDQLVWRPLIAWSDRFKVEMIENDNPPTSWFYDLMSKARLVSLLSEKVNQPLGEAFERFTLKRSPAKTLGPAEKKARKWPLILVSAALVLLIGYGFFLAVKMLVTVPAVEWGKIGLGVLSTFLRVAAALSLALLWTVPVGVLIGTNRKLSKILQPIVQITAAVPATALFPVLLLFILNLQGGLNLAAVILMLMGTQWYLLFNVIAGASAIPQDLIYTSKLMHLSGWQRWRTLILPAIFPYLVTGAITASGGAWNASIVAEYQNFGGRVLSATGIGSLIAQATSAGNYSLLLASTLSMILTVIVINRLVWRRLLNLAEEKYRME
jgi:NitT/TauT family transport system permease protein